VQQVTFLAPGISAEDFARGIEDRMVQVPGEQ
jgi:hypothetical protein